jgi:hypothetical protein
LLEWLLVLSITMALKQLVTISAGKRETTSERLARWLRDDGSETKRGRKDSHAVCHE